MHRNQSVDVHQFAMVPKADIPRAAFKMERAYKTTFDAGYLIPVFCEEVLPGDTWTVNATMFARLQPLVFPLMDNLHLDSFFFYVPNRLLWANWQRFMGERDPDPTSSISYTVPAITGNGGGQVVGSLYDYFGLPTAGQVSAGQNVVFNVLPLRAYNLIWNQWFRDETKQNSVPFRTTDGGDIGTDFVLLRRGKRHDYFTSCLPWPEKNGAAVLLPLSGSATVRTNATNLITSGAVTPLNMGDATNMTNIAGVGQYGSTVGGVMRGSGAAMGGVPIDTAPRNLYADLSTATASTINSLRLAFQTQRLLERDARGGTRYTEILRAHFGVMPPDFRLQRPEYLGGGSSPVNVHEVEQTTQTGLTGGSTPLGNVAGRGTMVSSGHAFTASFVEHGYIIGLVSVRADLTYQQGLRKMWSRSMRYDFYWPVFANLGEQAVLNQEIYVMEVDE